MPNSGTVPDYRHVHSPVMAVVTNNAGYNPITQRVRDEVFFARRLPLIDGIIYRSLRRIDAFRPSLSRP
jgi:hypothetical protein